MVRQLEMPNPFTRPGIQADQGIAEEVVPVTMTIVIIGRRFNR
jgi:hypothetical protein